MAGVPTPLPLGQRGGTAPPPTGSVEGGQVRRFRDGDVIVPQGAPPEVLFVVEEGVVALATVAASGHRCVVDLLGPGDPFNEGVLTSPRKTSGNDGGASDTNWPEARAVGSCVVLAIPRTALEARLQGDAPLGMWLAVAMASRVAEAQRALARSLSLGARERTLALLRTLARRWGRPSKDGAVIDVRLTQDDLAAMLGLARESVNRALRELTRAGAVRRSGRSYLLAPRSGSED